MIYVPLSGLIVAGVRLAQGQTVQHFNDFITAAVATAVFVAACVVVWHLATKEAK